MTTNPKDQSDREFWELLGPLTEFEREEIERYTGSGRFETDQAELLDACRRKSQERIERLIERGKFHDGEAPQQVAK